MSPKQWLALLCFFVSYLFFGASVFYHIETDLEAERRAANKLERLQLHELIIASVPDNETLVAEIYSKVNELCDTDVHIHAPPKPYEWTFYHSFFFSFIVCSTIGYGNISPHSVFGRMFLILYALIGIPVNGFLFAGLGDFFGKTFIGVYNRYRIYKMATTKNYMPMRFTLIGRILLYLLPGIVFFIFIPACIFSYFEEWPYTTSIYYSFVTLTTIGFGDFVATFNSDEKEFGPVYYFYEIFVIFWFIFGLGYLVMILGFIAKGMRSKRITRLEHQLASNIKSTQQRIWQGVTKDVGYLRRILNELYMMKFKPVYTDEDPDYAQTLHRSNSCPDDLHLYRHADDEDAIPHPRRRRAVSVPHWDETTSAVPSISMLRIQSDTDLTRIDRERTFDRAASESFRHEHILAKVVSALGAIRPSHDDGTDAHSVLDLGTMEAGGGVHGFSDADILASEYVASGWTLNQSMDGGYSVPKHRRARAASVFSVPTMVDPSGGSPGTSAYEWTWSGQNAAQVQEFLRGKTKPRKHSLFRNVFVKDHSAGDLHGSVSSEKVERSRTASVSINMPPSTSMPDVQATSTSTGSVFAPTPQPPAAAAINTSLFTKLNPFRRRILSEHGHRHSLTGLDTLSPAQYLERSARGRPSQPFGPKQYLQATARGRKSAFSVMTTAEPAHDDVLENTTIADLIRALEVVHTTVQRENYGAEAGTGAGSPDSPRRKMGLASLSPPKMSPVAALRNAGRRGSLRPQPTYTTVFNSKLLAPGMQRTAAAGSSAGARRPSHHFTLDSNAINMDNASGMLDQHGQPPPPYDMRASPKNRRFSVRPTNLSMAPGQVFQIPSVQVQSAVQRRMSLKPSPLARGGTGQSSARYARDTHFASAARGVESPRMARHQLQPGGGVAVGAATGPPPAAAGRTVMWRPKLVQSVRTRHGSLSELHEERNERKRSDSK